MKVPDRKSRPTNALGSATPSSITKNDADCGEDDGAKTDVLGDVGATVGKK